MSRLPLAVDVQRRRKRWPDGIKLIERDERQAIRDHEQQQRELAEAEERRRIRAGQWVISREQAAALYANKRFLARLTCEPQPWSAWMVPEETPGFLVEWIETADDPYILRVCDLRGLEVGLFDNATLRLDHFVSWEEFHENYKKWSAEGLGHLVIAPSDITETGVVPTQPGGVVFPEEDSPPPEPEVFCQARPTGTTTLLPLLGPPVGIPTPAAIADRSCPAIAAATAAAAGGGVTGPMLMHLPPPPPPPPAPPPIAAPSTTKTP